MFRFSCFARMAPVTGKAPSARKERNMRVASKFISVAIAGCLSFGMFQATTSAAGALPPFQGGGGIGPQCQGIINEAAANLAESKSLETSKNGLSNRGRTQKQIFDEAQEIGARWNAWCGSYGSITQ